MFWLSSVSSLSMIDCWLYYPYWMCHHCLWVLWWKGLYCMWSLSPFTETDETIDLAQHIAQVNCTSNTLHPPSMTMAYWEVAECILCHSPSSSTLCLTCEKKKKYKSVMILLDSGSSKHCTNDITLYRPYPQPQLSHTALQTRIFMCKI